VTTLVHHFLEASAARLPDKVALVCDGARYTYRQLDEMANRLAHAFQRNGVEPGDRVAIYLHNSLETVVSIFAALKAAAVFVVVNRTTKTDKLVRILNDCRATGCVTDRRALASDAGDRLMADVPSLRTFVSCGDRPDAAPRDRRVLHYADVQSACPAERPANRRIDLDLACLIYTSGTTGEPKGVMSDHSNVVFASGSIIEYLRNVESDIVLSVLPLSFDYGLYQLLMTFRFGGTLVLESSFAFPAALLARLQAERATGLPGVPSMFATLLQMDLAPYDLSTIRYLTNTAASLPPRHILDLRRKFPSAAIFSMYGLTETKRTLYLPPELLDRKPGSVGIAIPGTEVWLQDESGRRLGAGDVGELVVRGRHVMRGYWEAPELTSARYRPGPIPGERVCHTGDLFRMDEDGCFYFVGRRDDIIKSRGEKVAPREVENVLHALDGVAEAAVVGVPDPILGHAVKAVIVRSNPQLLTSQVLAYCKAHLEDFMIPKFVEFRDCLPKSPSGKVRKEMLA